jgi:hypothetical protein
LHRFWRGNAVVFAARQPDGAGYRV